MGSEVEPQARVSDRFKAEGRNPFGRDRRLFSFFILKKPAKKVDFLRSVTYDVFQ